MITASHVSGGNGYIAAVLGLDNVGDDFSCILGCSICPSAYVGIPYKLLVHNESGNNFDHHSRGASSLSSVVPGSEELCVQRNCAFELCVQRNCAFKLDSGCASDKIIKLNHV